MLWQGHAKNELFDLRKKISRKTFQSEIVLKLFEKPKKIKSFKKLIDIKALQVSTNQDHQNIEKNLENFIF